ncbi:MAG: hypothetical protein AAF250_03060 [Pseudomonadota bacterium]
MTMTLGIPDPTPITVEYWQDPEAYQTAMEDTLGMRAPGSRGYVTGPDNVRILIVGQPDASREAVHELIHALTLQLNPDFGNNPRWLWESVAQYYAGERRDLAVLEGAFAKGCPTIETLNSPFDQGGTIYSVGYSIGEFVESKWGPKALPDLVVTNGDTDLTLGISLDEFHRQWCESAEQGIRNQAQITADLPVTSH